VNLPEGRALNWVLAAIVTREAVSGVFVHIGSMSIGVEKWV
jgi:hypothetical protein